MTNYQADITQSPEFQQELVAQRSFMNRVYTWMAAGLILTAVSALVVATTAAKSAIFGQPAVVIGLFVGMIVISMIFNFAQAKINATFAAVLFVLYCLLFGVTTGAAVLLIYKGSTIASAFFIAAAMFGGMSIYGYTTKRDLMTWSTFLYMGVFGLIIASIVSLFFANPLFMFLINMIGVIVFTGLTAYYTQLLKHSYANHEAGSDGYKKSAIFGAFALYICFVEIFLFLLRLFASSRD